MAKLICPGVIFSIFRKILIPSVYTKRQMSNVTMRITERTFVILGYLGIYKFFCRTHRNHRFKSIENSIYNNTFLPCSSCTMHETSIFSMPLIQYSSTFYSYVFFSNAYTYSLSLLFSSIEIGRFVTM